MSWRGTGRVHEEAALTVPEDPEAQTDLGRPGNNPWRWKGAWRSYVCLPSSFSFLDICLQLLFKLEGKPDELYSLVHVFASWTTGL